MPSSKSESQRTSGTDHTPTQPQPVDTTARWDLPADSTHETRTTRTRIGQAEVVDTSRPEADEPERGKGSIHVKLPDIATGLPVLNRPAEALRLAQEAFAQTGYWVSFYRSVLGPEGVAMKLFPTEQEWEFFETTPEFSEIHKMLAALRTSDLEKPELVEPQRVITLRIPKSLHQAMVKESQDRHVSVNKLCISKLLMRAKPEFVPEERGRVRGRKPNGGR